MKMKLKINSISGKALLSIITIALLSMLVGALIVSSVVERTIAANYEAAKNVTVGNIPQLLAPSLENYDYQLVENTLTHNLKHKYIASIAVYDQRGILIRAVEETGTAQKRLSFEKYEISSNGEVLGNVEIGFYTGYIPEQTRDTTLALLFGLAGVFALAAFALVLLVRRFVIIPLEVLTNSVEQLDTGDLTARVKVIGEDEIGRLGINFNRMAEDLQQHVQDLEHAVTERKRAEERISYLNSVLRAIRNVNQLITREKDRQGLIQRSCDLLVQRKGYDKAWIVLFDDRGDIATAAGAGLGKDASTLQEQMKTGACSTLLKELLAHDQPFIACDRVAAQHQECDLAFETSGEGAFRGKLEYEGKLYGALSVSVPIEAVHGKEDQDLFLELSGDIAFALANIEKEEMLHVAHERYRTMIRTSIDGFLVVDTQGRFVDVNAAYCRLTGYSREEILAMSVQDVEVVETPEETAARIQRVLETGGDHFEAKHRCQDGRIVDLEVSVNYLGTEGLMFAFVRDVTERKRAEEAARQSEEMFRTLAEELPNIIFINKMGRVVYTNMIAEEIMGYKREELYSPDFDFLKLIATESLDLVKANFARHTEGQHVSPYECKLVTKDGKQIDTIIATRLITHLGERAILGIITDITERKKMQEQFMAQDRLASIGQLTSGVAHELNNPLTSVIGFSELLLERDLPEDVKQDLRVVNDGAMRTARIVKNLLTFARKQPQEKALLNVNENIEKVLELRAYEQKVSNIQVNTNFASDLPEIMANGFQLEQVFLNIIINAEYFMLEAHQRGNLTITTERKGDFVRISFADDGPGIPRENMPNLFTPFFTTKDVGKGTGLGLSICYGIITEHGGKIYAESELRKGATFIIELPIKQTDTTEKAAR